MSIASTAPEGSDATAYNFVSPVSVTLPGIGADVATGLRRTFTKQRSDSSLIVVIGAGGYVSATNVLQWSVRINGVTTVCQRRWTNETSSHKWYCGTNIVTGVPAGTFVAELMVNVAVGMNALLDSGDTVTFWIIEVLP